MNIENLIEAYHDEQMEWERVHRLAKEAVDFANRLGIYAVPRVHAGKIYWNPRLKNGKDPEPWAMNNQPTHSGWLSWADAVYSLGMHLTQQPKQ